jgi:hypothetical protein
MIWTMKCRSDRVILAEFYEAAPVRRRLFSWRASGQEWRFSAEVHSVCARVHRRA